MENQEGQRLVGLGDSQGENMDRFVARPRTRSVGNFWIPFLYEPDDGCLKM